MRKSLFLICALCALILNTTVYNVHALAASDITPSTAATDESLDNNSENSTNDDKSASNKKTTENEALNVGDMPNVASEAAIVMEASTGTILYAKNIHEKHYPASITKVLTTLVALENSTPGEIVTFSKNAIYDVDLDSSRIGIDVGEKLTMEQSLYAVMLESANEVSYAVAEHVAGSVSAFSEMMNKKAASLGCVDSNFINPHGLPDENHYTSAYDMALISRAAINNEAFRKITGTKTYTIPPTNIQKESRYLANHHGMIKGSYSFEGTLGGKTGYTSKAKYTLVTFAERDGMTLISVIMYCDSIPNEYGDTEALLNYGFENYTKHNVVNEVSSDKTGNTELFTQYAPLFSRTTSPLKLSSTGSVILPKGVKFDEAESTISYSPLDKLREGDNNIGTMRFTYDNTYVGSADIVYSTTSTNYVLNNNFIPETPKTIVTKGVSMPQETQDDNGRLRIIIIAIIIIVILVSVTLYLFFVELPYRKRKNAYNAKRKKSKRYYSKNDYLDL